MRQQISNVQSVERALQILSCFTIEEKSLSVKEISSKLLLPKSTVVRLLQTLKSQRFIEQDNLTQLYQLGFKVFELGNAYAATIDLRQVALPIMRAFNEETLETVSLNVLDGYNRVCIEKVESNQQIRNFVKVGGRSALCYGASGKLLFSYLTNDEQRLVMQQEELDSTEQENLLEQAQHIRNVGYALSLSERIEGLLSISSPIFDSKHNVVGGLSISGPVIRMGMKQDEVIQSLLKASKEISEKMGCIQLVSSLEME